MKRNSKFSVALHLLGHMAVRPDEPLTSDTLSGFARTNPVVVRRVLGALKSNGIVLSEKGHAGGWKLGRQADAITIADIYLALGDRFLRPAPTGEDNPIECDIERVVAVHLDEALNCAEETLVKQLGQHTVADLANGLQI